MTTNREPTATTDYFFLLLGRYRSPDGKEQWLKNVDTLQVTTNIEEAIKVAFPSADPGDHQLVLEDSYVPKFVLEDSFIPGPRTIVRDMYTTDGRLIDLPGFLVVPCWQLPQTLTTGR